MRAFLAFDIEDQIKEYLDEIVKELKKVYDGVKWVRKENHHITLKFFENIEEKKALKLKETLMFIEQRYEPFFVTLNGIDFFPNKNRARVIVLGLKEGKERLKEIFEDIEKALSKLGIERERREYRPHLTLGRKRVPSPLEAFEPVILKERSALIEKITFFKSTLLPEGPVYDPLWEIKFGKKF